MPPRSLTEYKYPADPSVKYQGHRREALTMGVPPQQLDWHLFVVLGISNSAREQGETKISPGCHSTRHAVLQPVKLPSFGFEQSVRLVSSKLLPSSSLNFRRLTHASDLHQLEVASTNSHYSRITLRPTVIFEQPNTTISFWVLCFEYC